MGLVFVSAANNTFWSVIHQIVYGSPGLSRSRPMAIALIAANVARYDGLALDKRSKNASLVVGLVMKLAADVKVS